MEHSRVPLSRRFLLLVAVALGSASLAVFGSASCATPQDRYSGNVQSVTVGYQPHVAGTLIHIAENQNIFASSGLSVAFKEYESGAEAINGLVRGEVDLGVATEFVFVQHVLNKEDFRALASISRVENTFLVARMDRGIRTPADLNGKRIGVRPQVSGRFYLGRLLELNGLSIQQVVVIDISTADFVRAIADGEVDAVVTYPPHVGLIKARLDEAAIAWPIQSGQFGYSPLVARSDWIGKHPDLVNRFLRSLVQAEEYYVLHPDESKAIVQKKLKYDDETMAANWAGSQFTLSLEQALILAMESEARWMIRNNLTSERLPPDFLAYVYEDGLKALKPEAVAVIR